ncbi:MAG: hypothetical protein IJ658_00425 [Kiritimatiellae bacterium]|nr:hypothetical protein [Kiritimatiellia bacterium]
MDEARELVSDPALWPRVRDFLWDFAPQVHSSWLEGLETSDARRDGKGFAPAVSRLMSSSRTRRFILSSLGVEPCFHTFPKDDWSRLLLLDGATLESMVKWLGALACADRLRGVTDGKAVRALKAALPGVYPDVFGYTAYFGRSRIGNLEVKVEEGRIGEIGVFGCGILLSLLGTLPPALVSRLKLKLPKAYSGAPPLEAVSPSPVFSLQLLSRLLKLKFPEAYSICCS